MKPIVPRSRPWPFDRDPFRRWLDYLSRDIWLLEPEELPRPRAAVVRVFRVVLLTLRGLRDHKGAVRAAALTYYSVLSVVPVLAISFAVARGLGAYEELKEEVVQPFLDEYLPAVPLEEEPEADLVLGPAAGPPAPRGETEPAAPPPGEDVAGPVAEAETPRDPDDLPPAAGPPVETSAPAQLRDAIDQVLGSVERTEGLPLGAFGLAVLLYTAVNLLSAVERSLNEIWGARGSRSWGRRFSDYVAIVVVAPILLLAGTAALATIRTVRIAPPLVDGELDLGQLLSILLEATPLLTSWLGLTFAYMVLCKARVPLRSAAIGGAVASLLWYGSVNLYVELQVGVAKYDALYAGFAAIPIFLVFCYLSWLIFLVGAEVAFAHHSVPLFTSIQRTGTVDHAFRRSLALRLCGRVADRFLRGVEPASALELAADLGAPPRAALDVLDLLVARSVLVRATREGEDGYLPARDPEGITVVDVLLALDVEPGSTGLAPRGALDERVERILVALEREARASLHNYTLRELALAAREEAEGRPAGAPLPLPAPGEAGTGG